MTFPAVIFSLAVATLFGSLMHLWRGGNFFHLALYLVLSWMGFFGGHFLADRLSIRFLEVGTIHMGFGILGSFLFLGLGWWLGLNDQNKIK